MFFKLAQTQTIRNLQKSKNTHEDGSGFHNRIGMVFVGGDTESHQIILFFFRSGSKSSYPKVWSAMTYFTACVTFIWFELITAARIVSGGLVAGTWMLAKVSISSSSTH